MLLKTHISQSEDQTRQCDKLSTNNPPWLNLFNIADLPLWKKTALALLVMLCLGAITAWKLWEPSPSILIPQSNSPFQYYISAATDAEDPNSTQIQGVEGDIKASTINVQSSEQRLIYDFVVSETTLYPYATLGYAFSAQSNQQNSVDISTMASASFKVSCFPATKLTFFLSSLDTPLSRAQGEIVHRSAGQQFSCNENEQLVNVDFNSMAVPQWWLLANNVDLADNKIDLSQTVGFGFAISPQTVKGEKVEVHVETLKFNAQPAMFERNLILIIPLLCLAFMAALLVKINVVGSGKSSEPEEKKDAKSEEPTVEAPNKIIDPPVNSKNEKLLTHREKEKNNLLKFLNEEYTNSDLSLELCTAVLGINRNKVNAILKEEVGKTFSGYLNELRLSKAAQYLIQQPEAQVSEVAYSVGYGNVSYFNKLFKSHYGCSPGSYRQELENAG